MILIRETTMKSISDSTFYQSQLYVIIFENAVLQSSSGNTFDGMNKGVKFTKESNGTLSNSTFQNMVQNIKDGDLYQSNVATDGSAITIVDSNVVVENCTFIGNIAKNGGAISVS